MALGTFLKDIRQLMHPQEMRTTIDPPAPQGNQIVDSYAGSVLAMAIALSILAVACGDEDPSPLARPIFTATAISSPGPSHTPLSTESPFPTETPTPPVPSLTARPTVTAAAMVNPSPSDTPSPTESPTPTGAQIHCPTPSQRATSMPRPEPTHTPSPIPAGRAIPTRPNLLPAGLSGAILTVTPRPTFTPGPTPEANLRLPVGNLRDITISIIPGSGVHSLASGDVNNDRVADLIIGSMRANYLVENKSRRGRTYVVFGPLEASAIDLTAEVDITIEGAELVRTRPTSLVASGDVNDDGVDDLIVGSPQSGVAGEIRVLFGPLGPGTRDILTDADITISGSGYRDFDPRTPQRDAGRGLAVGDFNNDGVDDLAIGAPLTRPEIGQIYILFGPLDRGTFEVPLDADLVMTGIDDHDRFGTALAGGDVNCDGVEDLIIGAPGASPRSAGETYVVFGPVGEGILELPTQVDITIQGVVAVDGSGSSLGSWDFDGDGASDLIIGASRGRPMVLLGPLEAGTVDLLTDADIVIYGLPGGAPMAAGDINGDGAVDSIIALGGDRPIYVHLGAPRWLENIKLADEGAATPTSPTPGPTATPTITPTPFPTDRIVFVSRRDGNLELYVMGGDGANQTRFTGSATAEITPAWSPGGSKIAFASDQEGNFQIYVMAGDGSSQTRLTTNSGVDTAPNWSADGRQIVFASEGNQAGTRSDRHLEIYVMSAVGSGQTRLPKEDAGEFVKGSCTVPSAAEPAKGMGFIRHMEMDPAWSPDARKIAFTFRSYCHPSTIPIPSSPFFPRNESVEIYVMDADGSNRTRITNNRAFDGWPTWSPDGSKLAFESDRDGDSEIYVMAADGSKQIRLTNNDAFDGQPTWDPDGSKLAFVSDRDGNREIYLMAPDGSNQTRLTDNPESDEHPDWFVGAVR